MEKLKNLPQKRKIILFAAGIAAIVAVIVFCSIIAADRNKIDLSEDYTVKIEGLDTRGTASCQINEKKLETTLMGKNSDFIRDNLLMESMKYDLSKRDNLKNGDKITVTITYDDAIAKQLNLSFKNMKRQIDVSGLPEGKEVDVFKDLKVSYTGVSPEGKVSLINNSNDPFASIVTFRPSKEKVANGDKIIVEAVYSDQDATEHKALVKVSKKSYSVSGLPEYVTKANQFNSKNLLNIKSINDKQVKDELKLSIPSFVNHLADLNTAPDFTFEDNYSYKNIQLKQAYLYTQTDNADNHTLYFKHNSVCTVSSVDIIANGKTVGTAYMVAEIRDAIIDNGKINGTDEGCGHYNSFEEAQQAAKDYYSSSGYNVEPIKIE